MITTEELEARIERIPFSGCWLWTGSVGSHGYGDIRRRPRYGLAHRISYEMNVGPIPVGMHVLHKCDVRSCVNPSHLFLGTNADNISDRMAKGRSKGPSYRPTGLKYTRRSPSAYDCARKATPEQRAKFREEYANRDVSIRELAVRGGVSYRAMWGYLHA